MNCWEFLNIDPTIDIRQIKRAYAKLVQRYHPEDDPGSFQLLRKAYEQALEQSKYLDSEAVPEKSHQKGDTGSGGQTDSLFFDGNASEVADCDAQSPETDMSFEEESPESIIRKEMETIIGIYMDFSKRKDPAQWEAVLAGQLLWPIDARIQFGFQLFDFIGQNPLIPPAVWGMMNEHYAWYDNATKLYHHFPEDFVDNVLWHIHNHGWALRYDTIPLVNDVDYDAYLVCRQRICREIIAGDIPKATAYLDQALSIIHTDPDVQRLSIAVSRIAGEKADALNRSEQFVADHPTFIEAYLERAYLRLSNTDPLNAMRDFQHALDIAPENLAGLNGLACCHIALGNYFEAQKLFEQALERCPDHVETHVEMIRLCRLLVEKLTPELEKKEADPRIPLQLADAYFSGGRYGKAKQILKSYLKDTQNSDVHLLWARVLERLDQGGKALKKFNAALVLAAQSGENQYTVLKYRGFFHHSQGTFEAAVADLDKARKMIFPVVDAELWFHLADSLRSIGQYQEAIDLFDALIEVDDNEPKYFRQRGLALFDMEKFGAALKDFEYALERDYYSKSRIWVARCHMEMNRYDLAPAAIDAADDFGANSEDLHYCRARCAFHHQDYETAKQEIEKGLGFNEDKAESLQLGGTICQRLGDDKAAGEYFKRFARQPEASTQNRIQIAKTFIEKNRSGVAAACLDEIPETEDDLALLLNTTELLASIDEWWRAQEVIEKYFSLAEEQENDISSIAYFLRGKIKYRKHIFKPAKCLDDLRKACELDACDMAYYYLGMVYFDLRDIPNAKMCAQQALERFPDNPVIRNMVKGIDRFEGFGWIRRYFVSSKAHELWQLRNSEPLYTFAE